MPRGSRVRMAPEPSSSGNPPPDLDDPFYNDPDPLPPLLFNKTKVGFQGPPLYLPLIMQTPNDYLRDWVPKLPTYLNKMLDSEAPPPDRTCSWCRTEFSQWRCQDCFGRPFKCTACCRKAHAHLPLHRVQRWVDNRFFEGSWLYKVGVEIHVGHVGRPCPTRPSGAGFPAGLGALDEEVEVVNPEEELTGASSEPLHPKPSTVVVDKSGIHHLKINYCTCEGAEPMEYQLFELGLFAASSLRPKTVFTFPVLDDFLIDNLECKTSGHSYYNNLRKVTSKAFPQSVVVSLMSYFLGFTSSVHSFTCHISHFTFHTLHFIFYISYFTLCISYFIFHTLHFCCSPPFSVIHDFGHIHLFEITSNVL